MAIVHKSRVGETAANTPDASTAFTLSGANLTNFRTFSSQHTASDLLTYRADNLDASGTDWEEGIATYTAGTLTRTLVTASSNSNAAVNFSTAGLAVKVRESLLASINQNSDLMMQAATPGGRLTLESGVPVSTTDQTAKTNIYYTPYIHNIIVLWNGTYWQPIEFTEYTFAIGTGLTANLPYDLFAYLNNGALAIEKLAWTSATTRATNVTLQDGRYCKSGDKTRLLLGTFSPYSTTQVADTLLDRGVGNLYNSVLKSLKYSAGSSPHTYTADSTPREYNNTSGVAVVKLTIPFVRNFIGTTTCSLNVSAGTGTSYLAMTVDGANFNVNYLAVSQGIVNLSVQFPTATSMVDLSAGRRILYLTEGSWGSTDGTYDYGEMRGSIAL